MSRQLVESILSNNMLEANDMVEAKLAEIREKKLYEMKRMFAAESDYGSEYTKQKIASGKYRLLTPAERQRGAGVDPSIKPGGSEHPFGVKDTEEKPKSKPKPKKSREKGPIRQRWDKEVERFKDRLDKASARHLSKHDVEGGKSTWARTPVGKTTSVVGKAVKGALGSDLASELRSIGTSNLK